MQLDMQRFLFLKQKNMLYNAAYFRRKPFHERYQNCSLSFCTKRLFANCSIFIIIKKVPTLYLYRTSENVYREFYHRIIFHRFSYTPVIFFFTFLDPNIPRKHFPLALPMSNASFMKWKKTPVFVFRNLLITCH